jgi:hypothetical protein
MTRTAYSDAFFQTTLRPDLQGSLVDPDYAPGVKGIYYPLHEISKADRREKNYRILINRPYLEEYLRNSAHEDRALMRRILAASPQTDTAAAIEKWVDDEITRMWK